MQTSAQTQGCHKQPPKNAHENIEGIQDWYVFEKQKWLGSLWPDFCRHMNTKLKYSVQWGSVIWTSLDFKWSKRGWVANGPNFEWELKSRSQNGSLEKRLPYSHKVARCYYVALWSLCAQVAQNFSKPASGFPAKLMRNHVAMISQCLTLVLFGADLITLWNNLMKLLLLLTEL